MSGRPSLYWGVMGDSPPEWGTPLYLVVGFLGDGVGEVGHGADPVAAVGEPGAAVGVVGVEIEDEGVAVFVGDGG